MQKDAQQAMRMMTGVWLGSRAIRCNWANQKTAAKPTSSKSADFESVLKQTPNSNTTIYVGNIAPDTNERQLRDVFEEFGRIEEVRIQGDKGYAFVKYRDHHTAADAIINGTGKIIGMRTIRCSWGKEKTETETTTVSGIPVVYPPLVPVQMGMVMPQVAYGGQSYAVYPVPQMYAYPQNQVTLTQVPTSTTSTKK